MTTNYSKALDVVLLAAFNQASDIKGLRLHSGSCDLAKEYMTQDRLIILEAVDYLRSALNREPK
jgi:hypothetical protein